MLSTTSEYALRALARLAGLPRGTTMLGRKLSRETGIPANYLAKIMLSLSHAGLVAATRGSGGGYWLLRPADAVRLRDIVAVFDGPAVTSSCLLGRGQCSDQKAAPCTAHRPWRRVQAAYARFLEGTTLADISAHPPRRGSPNPALTRLRVRVS